MIFFTTSNYIVLTSNRIIQVAYTTKEINFIDRYVDLIGVTKSLRLGSTNFIMHFDTRADEEFMCDHRDELIDTLS